jgi:hypothetical protein
MRRGGKDCWGHRGGDAYQGHGRQGSIGDKLEPVNRESENYRDAMDNPQDPGDPDFEQYDGDISNDDDDEII